MGDRLRDQFVRDEEAKVAQRQAEELMHMLLADMASVARVRFLAAQLVQIGHPAAFEALLEARNALTLHIADMLSDQMEREFR